MWLDLGELDRVVGENTDFRGGIPHNFGGTTMQRISGPGGSRFRLVLQWDSPFFSVSGAHGTQNDVDVYVLASNGLGGFFVVSDGTTDNLASGDPFDALRGRRVSNPFGPVVQQPCSEPSRSWQAGSDRYVGPAVGAGGPLSSPESLARRGALGGERGLREPARRRLPA